MLWNELKLLVHNLEIYLFSGFCTIPHTLHILSLLPPSNSPFSPAKGISRFLAHSELPHSLSTLFCSFFKKFWSFEAAVPKFSSFSRKQNWFLPHKAPWGLLLRHPLSGSGSSSISPSVPTGSEAAAAVWKAAIKVTKPAGCFSPRKILGRNQYLCTSYLFGMGFETLEHPWMNRLRAIVRRGKEKPTTKQTNQENKTTLRYIPYSSHN